jgi:hypothetical protein
MMLEDDNPIHRGTIVKMVKDSGKIGTTSALHNSDSPGSDDLTKQASIKAMVDAAQIGLAERMWTWEYIGLYAQYAAVGLLYGMSGMS